MPERLSIPYLVSPRSLFRLGLLLVLGAVAFFLRYSFEQGWIGPTARVAMAATAGTAMIVTSTQIAHRRPAYANALAGAGGAVLYLTAFAAHQRYGLTDPTGAMIALSGVSATVVGLALRHRSELLAMAGMAGAVGAPLILGGRLDIFPGEVGYQVTVLSLATALYLIRRWMWLFAAAVGGVGAVVGVDLIAHWLGSTTVSAIELQIGIGAVWLLGWLGALAGAHRFRDNAITATVLPLAALSVLPVFGTGATLSLWGIGTDDVRWVLITFGVASVSVIARFSLAGTRVGQVVASAHLVPAALVSIAGWMGTLRGGLLLAAIAAQAGIMVVVGARTHESIVSTTGHVIGVAVALMWTIVELVAADRTFDSSDIGTGLVVVTAAVVAFAIRLEPEPHATLSRVYGALSLLAALVWAAFSLGSLDDGPGLVTGVWAAIGFGVIAWGAMSEAGLVRNIGIGVVLLAVTKLLVIDTATASPVVRISLFAGIGLALLVFGYWLGTADEPSAPAGDDQTVLP
ncbi:MAG: DUF2339 domain-containing protein [Acidimicrobiia bacterium]|nr:DUF2339 domain-containing protein [Acidimicrobiia bacterium]